MVMTSEVFNYNDYGNLVPKCNVPNFALGLKKIVKGGRCGLHKQPDRLMWGPTLKTDTAAALIR